MIKAIKGDTIKITDVQAIVNTANSSLLGDGGVDDAIHRAAGRELLFGCRLPGGCKTGQAKIIKGYNLHHDYAIHTVGPVWNSGGKNEAEFLGQYYYNSMKVAPENGIRRIAFPPISTDIYCFPVEQAVRITVRAVSSFLNENEQAFELIEWVLFDNYMKQVYDEVAERLRQGV